MPEDGNEQPTGQENLLEISNKQIQNMNSEELEELTKKIDKLENQEQQADKPEAITSN